MAQRNELYEGVALQQGTFDDEYLSISDCRRVVSGDAEDVDGRD